MSFSGLQKANQRPSPEGSGDLEAEVPGVEDGSPGAGPLSSLTLLHAASPQTSPWAGLFSSRTLQGGGPSWAGSTPCPRGRPAHPPTPLRPPVK